MPFPFKQTTNDQGPQSNKPMSSIPIMRDTNRPMMTFVPPSTPFGPPTGPIDATKPLPQPNTAGTQGTGTPFVFGNPPPAPKGNPFAKFLPPGYIEPGSLSESKFDPKNPGKEGKARHPIYFSRNMPPYTDWNGNPNHALLSTLPPEEVCTSPKLVWSRDTQPNANQPSTSQANPTRPKNEQPGLPGYVLAARK